MIHDKVVIDEEGQITKNNGPIKKLIYQISQQIQQEVDAEIFRTLDILSGNKEE